MPKRKEISKADNFKKDMVRAIIMEELIDRVTLLTAKNKKLEFELEITKSTEIESKKQLNYIN